MSAPRAGAPKRPTRVRTRRGWAVSPRSAFAGRVSGRWPGVRVALVLFAALVAGCSSGSESFLGFTGSTLSGTVVLSGTDRDAVGNMIGSRVITTADGVEVALLHDGVDLGSTRTQAGAYQFAGLKAGSYRVVARLTGPLADTSAAIDVAHGAVNVPSPVTLAETDSLVAFPTPFTGSTRFQLAFPADEHARIDIRSLDGTVRRVLADRTFVAGVHAITWDATDDGGQKVAPGAYWVVVQCDTGWRATLVVYAP